jgi:uncharacterized protein (TIGR03435 family)
LYAILTQAFTAFDYQLVVPEWTRVETFDVSAKLPEGSSRDDLKPMLQTLLKERFNMKMHRENRESAVYELVIADGGPKIKQVTAPIPPPPPGPEVDPDGYPNVPNGAGVRVLNGRARIQFPIASTKMLVFYLLSFVDRPVLDATGLKGSFAFTLSFSLPRPGAIASMDDDAMDPGPTIYEATEKQLGLKLKPAKRPVEIVVLDHLDRTPVEN